MKVLFVGAGSIGRRHIFDFYQECIQHGIIPQIYVLRRKIGDLGETEQYVYKQITEIPDTIFDVIFITNPTNLHYEALMRCKGKGKCYFVEKPIFETLKENVDQLGISDNNTYVAAPMRHTTIYKLLKEVVTNNRVFSVRAICSSYLPEWRENVDYREVYSAKKEMGGGVNLDLIHEIDYIYDLFGEPVDVCGISGKFSDLEITSNDLSTFLLRYENAVCEIHLDYFGRKSIRTCEVYTSEGTYVADFYKEILTKPDGEVIDCHVKENEEFVNEMNYFYNFILGHTKSINPPSLAIKTLEIALKGE